MIGSAGSFLAMESVGMPEVIGVLVSFLRIGRPMRGGNAFLTVFSLKAQDMGGAYPMETLHLGWGYLDPSASL